MDVDKCDSVPIAVDQKRQRRRFSKAEKQQIVEQTLTGDVSVSQVARAHDVNANQLFKWRKLYREGQLGAEAETGLVPVVMQVSPSISDCVGSIEIDLGNGRRMVVNGSVAPATLRAALEVLR